MYGLYHTSNPITCFVPLPSKLSLSGVGTIVPSPGYEVDSFTPANADDLSMYIYDGDGALVYNGSLAAWEAGAVCTAMSGTGDVKGVCYRITLANRNKPTSGVWAVGTWSVQLWHTVAGPYYAKTSATFQWDDIYSQLSDQVTAIWAMLGSYAGTSGVGNNVKEDLGAVLARMGAYTGIGSSNIKQDLSDTTGRVTVAVDNTSDILGLTTESVLKAYLAGSNTSSGLYTLTQRLGTASSGTVASQVEAVGATAADILSLTSASNLKAKLASTGVSLAADIAAVKADTADVLGLTSASNLKGYLAGTATGSGLYQVMGVLECASWSWDAQPGMGGTVYRDLEWIAAQMGIPASGTIAQQTDKIQSIKDMTDGLTTRLTTIDGSLSGISAGVSTANDLSTAAVNNTGAIKDVTDSIPLYLGNIHDAVVAAQKIGVRLQRMLNDGAMFGGGESTQLLFAQFLDPATGEPVVGGTATFVVKRASGTDITGNATWDGDSLWLVPNMQAHFEDRKGVWRVELTHSTGLTQGGLFLYGANAYEFAKIAAVFQMSEMSVNRITGVVTVYDPENPTAAVAEFDLRNADGSLPLPAKAVLNRSKARPPTP